MLTGLDLEDSWIWRTCFEGLVLEDLFWRMLGFGGVDLDLGCIVL